MNTYDGRTPYTAPVSLGNSVGLDGSFAAKHEGVTILRYAPIILTCKNCGLKNNTVKAQIILKLNTPIIDTAYLNKWTNLCNECEQKIVTEIEQKLSDWPKGNDSTEILSAARPTQVLEGMEES